MDAESSIDCEKVFAFATEMPKYPGGDDAAIAEINAAVNRVPCDRASAKFLRFIVNTEGKMISPVLLPGNLKVCSQELEKELRSLPSWVPAKQTGNPVCVNFTIPLN